MCTSCVRFEPDPAALLARHGLRPDAAGIVHVSGLRIVAADHGVCTRDDSLAEKTATCPSFEARST